MKTEYQLANKVAMELNDHINCKFTELVGQRELLLIFPDSYTKGISPSDLLPKRIVLPHLFSGKLSYFTNLQVPEAAPPRKYATCRKLLTCDLSSRMTTPKSITVFRFFRFQPDIQACRLAMMDCDSCAVRSFCNQQQVPLGCFLPVRVLQQTCSLLRENFTLPGVDEELRKVRVNTITYKTDLYADSNTYPFFNFTASSLPITLPTLYGYMGMFNDHPKLKDLFQAARG